MMLDEQNVSAQAAGNNSSPFNAPVFSDAYKALTAMGMSSLMIMAIFGNVLVILAFWFFKHLRTVNNCFILALAVSDMLVALIPLPLWMMYTLSDGTWWARDHTIIILNVWVFLDVTCGISSIFLLACISVERYISVAHALFYQRNASKKKAFVVIFVVWAAVITLAALRIALPSVPSPTFELIFAFGCFLLPLLIMILMYLLLLVFAKRQIKAASLSSTDGRTVRFLKETKIAKIMVVVVMLFFVCWFPFFLLHFFVLCEECMRATYKPTVINATKWLHYTNSVLNPIIYAGMNKDFRKCFKTILGNIYGCRRQRETMQQRSISNNNISSSKTNVTETSI